MTEPIDRLRAALAATYRIEREIGQGGMATVFLATDLKHHRSVAIKVLRPELAQSLGPERFLREIEIAAKLQHPNILPVYDSGDADGVLYYVMPFVEGESLRDRLQREGPLPPAEALRIAGEVTDALDYAHRQGIIHRDIKPANILLSQRHAVIADFGIARAVTASTTSPELTQVGMSVGSPAYMSPEQALGGETIDGRTDIFAVGVMLFEMLDGKPPFEGATPQSIIAQAMSTRRRELAADPLGVQPIITRALAPEPADRFATAGELGAALDGTTRGAGPAARPIGRRQTMIAAGIAVVLLAALVPFVIARVGGGSDEDPRKSLIVFPFRNQTGDPSREYLEDASVNLLTLAAAHWRDMRVYDDERTASLLKRREITSAADLDFESAQAMARDAGVGTLVLGDIRREGDSLAIEAKVHDVRSGDRIGTHLVRASLDADPRPLFDDLAARILGTSGAPPGERPSVLAQTTSSLEAYRSYLLGTSALQRFEVDTARKYLLRAVSLDSTFALAYVRLRDVEGWSLGAGVGGNTSLQRNWILTAERHSANLPPRLRSLVEYHREYQDGNYRRAREVAEGLIARDSTDVEAWYQLGEAHFHHNAASFPHPDTLGNIGRALRAFERALALDSAYILAYQHILDALSNCANSNVWVCAGDSATYGTPEELSRRFGDSTLARIRADTRRSQIATARGWTVVAPTTPRARLALVNVLYQQRMLDEAFRETEALARAGAMAPAGMWRAMVLFDQGKPGEAAAALDSMLRLSTDTLSMAVGQANTTLPLGILAGGGGRVEVANRLTTAIVRLLPLDSGNVAGGLRVSKTEMGEFIRGWVFTEAGVSEARQWGRDVQALITSRAKGDTAIRRMTTSNGTALLSVYLATRDTTVLSWFLARVDTTGSSTWRVAEALLALERRDTARARMRVDRHYRTPTNVEFAGETGMVRAYAWGDLLSRLNEPRLAIAAFARIDSAGERIQHPGLAVRALAELGALHQQLGERDRAIEYYERFIAAWRDADPRLQPMVEQARDAVQAIRTGAPAARPPG